MELSAQREDTVEARPVQQRESHRADAELVERERKVRVGPRQQLDAVTPEQRHVAFPQPQHGVDPEPGSAVVGRRWYRPARSCGEAGVDEERVACLER